MQPLPYFSLKQYLRGTTPPTAFSLAKSYKGSVPLLQSTGGDQSFR
jgi:hypothetical protein